MIGIDSFHHGYELLVSKTDTGMNKLSDLSKIFGLFNRGSSLPKRFLINCIFYEFLVIRPIIYFQVSLSWYKHKLDRCPDQGGFIRW